MELVNALGAVPFDDHISVTAGLIFTLLARMVCFMIHTHLTGLNEPKVSNVEEIKVLGAG